MLGDRAGRGGGYSNGHKNMGVPRCHDPLGWLCSFLMLFTEQLEPN